MNTHTILITGAAGALGKLVTRILAEQAAETGTATAQLQPAR